MQNEFRVKAGTGRRFTRPNQTVAPSLRLAATTRNRALLRWLRAAELTAWQDADIRRAVTARMVPTRYRVQPFFQLQSR